MKIIDFSKVRCVNYFLLTFMLVALPLYGLLKIPFILLFTVVSLFCYFSGNYRIRKELLPFYVCILYAIIISLVNGVFTLGSFVSWILLLVYLTGYSSSGKIDSSSFYRFLFLLLIIFSLDSMVQGVIGIDLLGNTLVAGGRVTGPFTWGAPVIGNFLMAFFFVPELVLKSRKIKALVYLLFLLVIFLAGTRGAMLQVIFCVFLLVLSIRYKILLGLALVLISLYIVPIINENIQSPALSRVLQLSSINETIIYESRGSGRIPFWVEYLPKMAEQFGVWGAGLGGLEKYLMKIGSPYIHPHSLYLEIWLSFGIFGSLFLFVFLVLLFKAGNQISRLILFSFWGPFNMLHSVFDFYWAIVLFTNLLLVLLINSSLKRKGSGITLRNKFNYS